MTTRDEEAAVARLAEELHNFEEIARCLNPSPGERPELRGIEVVGFTQPLYSSIGGDHFIYVDFKQRYDLELRADLARTQGRQDIAERLLSLRSKSGLLVADVSGHKITDALVCAMLHQAFLLGVNYELELFGEVTTRLFEYINTRFCKTTAINRFFTMIYGEVSEAGRFRFISAGHPPPVVFSREYGRFMPIDRNRLVTFPPVGVMPSEADPDERRRAKSPSLKREYEVNEIELLSPGDVAVLCTDGLLEHADGEFYNRQLEQILAAHASSSAIEIVRAIQEGVRNAGPASDDITTVVIRRAAP
jgi:serine phosphatase RsbU (regulator of sigma subunit)